MTSTHGTGPATGPTTGVVDLDGRCTLGRDRLGGKATSIDRMRALGLPGPPAFAITTDVCLRFRVEGGELPEDVWVDAVRALARLERETGHRFGDPTSPLLVSVRSGAAQSMPGMMDTVLNLGLSSEIADGLAAQTGDVDWARDTRARFERSYREVVDPAGPPDDPWAQLRAAICAVFRSWDSARARVYRERYGISHDGGTAVTVQAMVFGNRDDDSGTGVLFSRDPGTGEPELYGEWMARGQGEDVVSGAVTPASVAVLAERRPDLYAQLREVSATLEAEYRDMVDVEFTVESGRLHVLQVRPGKRGARATLRIAVDLAESGVIDRDTALSRVDAEVARAAAAAHDDGDTSSDAAPLATGTAAGPGRVAGRVVSDPDDALDADDDDPVVLVRPSTSPDDVPAMYASVAVVTEHGGTTSHAALVAREAGLPCVVGCGDGTVAALEGRTVTVDGGRGLVLDGDHTADDGPRAADRWEQALLVWAAERLGEDPGSAPGTLPELLDRLVRTSS